MPERETKAGAGNGRKVVKSVIQLEVLNRPGVMSEVCGLFAKKGFNLEGIAAMPIGDGSRSRVWLTIDEDRRSEHVLKQLSKIRDVVDIKLHGAGHEVFTRLETLFRDHRVEIPKPAASKEEPAGPPM